MRIDDRNIPSARTRTIGLGVRVPDVRVSHGLFLQFDLISPVRPKRAADEELFVVKDFKTANTNFIQRIKLGFQFFIFFILCGGLNISWAEYWPNLTYDINNYYLSPPNFFSYAPTNSLDSQICP
jgi:hypothetical protein